MSDKTFGVKQINIIGGSGTPTIISPNDFNINAINVGISTDISIGGKVVSDLIVGAGYSVGIGTTNLSSKLTVRGGDISVGVSTSHGVILTSPNGTQYRLIVDNSGNLDTVSI